MPSVRGRTRRLVAAGLIIASTTAGGLGGLVASVVAAPARPLVAARPDLVVALVVAVAGAGVLLDGIHLGTGRARPPAVGRQVPQAWTRLLDPRVVAVLFGARLGVGPLTILSTWGWWSATIASAVLGPGPAVLAGATFGFVRLVVTVAVSLWLERRDRAHRFGRLRSGRSTGWATLTGAGLLAVVSVAFAGCASTAARPEPLGEAGPPHPIVAGSASDLGAEAAAPWRPNPPSTVPADLEDLVRAAPALPTATTVPTPGAAGRPPAATGEPSTEPAALAAALPSGIDGFEVIAGPEADRFLDLRAAADIQPDPTEEIALLETRGFEGGWTRAFRSEANDVAVTSVYQFESAAQAEFYLEDGLITIGGYGGSFFDIDGLPGVRGFAQTFTDGDEELISLGASFQAGPRWFLVYLVGSPETVTPATLIPVVAEQRQRQLGPATSG